MLCIEEDALSLWLMRCTPYENVLFKPRQEYYVVFLGKICNLNSTPLHSGESWKIVWVEMVALKSLMGQLNLGHFGPRGCHQNIPVIAICQPFSSIFLKSHVFQILHYLSIVAVCQEVVPFCRCQKTVRVWRKSGRNIFNSWEMFQRRWRPPLRTFTHLHRVSSRYCILLFYLFLWLFFVNAVISPTSSVFAL